MKISKLKYQNELSEGFKLMEKYLQKTTSVCILFFLILFPVFSFATTRTWSGATTGTVAWAGNWGTNPVAGDDIVITTTGTLIITGMPTLALNSLTIHGGSNYTLEFQGANVLTLGGNASTDFVLDASTGFILSATNDPSITMAASSTSTIGGTFTINSAGTFTMSAASVVNTISTTGSIVNYGTITGATTAKLIFEGSSSYEHKQDGGTIPTADWDGASGTATSTCLVSGMTSTKPTGYISTANTFYHFTWNCASQTKDFTNAGGQVGQMVNSGENITCLGNFTMSSTNSHDMYFSDVSGGALNTFTVGGNMIMSASCLFILNFYSSPVTLNITGNLTISNMSFYAHAYATGATTSINITGDLNLSSGVYLSTYTSYTGVTLNVTRDVNVSGGSFFGSYSTGTSTHNITRDFNFSGGLFYGTFNSGAGAFSINGDLNISGGTFQGAWSGSPIYTILGNISLSGTGIFHATASTGDPTFNITGNFTTAGTPTFYASKASTGNPIFNIQGSVDLSTGTIAACNSYTSNAFTCTFNLTGTASNNLTLKTGLTYNTSATWKWDIASGRTITLLSNIELGGTASSCSFTNNGTLIMGTYTFPAVTTAAASFVNASGATLKTACLTGITTLGTATGAILVTGTRTYNSGASYVFNGTAAQITGTFATTVANLELNNAAGVTLSQGITISDGGTLTFTSGYHNLASYTLQLGTTAATTLTYTTGGLYSSTDNGSFKRYIPSGLGATGVSSTVTPFYGLFPFKKSAIFLNYLEFNNTAAVTTGGFITATPKFATTILDVTDFSDGNGTVTHIKSGKAIDITITIAGGTFDVKLSSGTFAGGSLTDYTLVKYTGPGVVATSVGTFSASTGSETLPVLNRTGVTTADIAGGWVVGTYNASVTTLPIELVSFIGKINGKNNELNWETATEINNDFFTIEKTNDGTTFEIVGIQNGAGNSTSYLNYSLMDYDVRNSINYYRLKQTDFDGKFTFSELISIDNRTNKIEKEIVMTTNILGQEVNQNYRGLVVIIYSDGTSIKVIQ